MVRTFLAAFAGLAVALTARGADKPPPVAEWVRQFETGDPGERVIAAESLGLLGPDAADAVPALVKFLAGLKIPDRVTPGDPPPFDRATGWRIAATRRTLVAVGPKAAPAVAGLLTHDSPAVRSLGAITLGELGPDAAAAVPALAKALADDSPAVRSVAAIALGKIGPAAAAAVPALAELVGDVKNFDEKLYELSTDRPASPRAAALAALAKLGPKGKAVLKEKLLPALIAEYKTAKPSPFTGPGIGLFYAIEGDADDAVPAVVGYIRRRDSGSELDSVLTMLRRFGPVGRKTYAELLRDKNPDLRYYAARCLALSQAYKADPHLADFTPQLLEGLKDDEKRIRDANVAVFSRMGEKAPKEAIEAFAARLTNAGKNPNKLSDAVYDMALFGRAAVPVLTAGLKSADDVATRTVYLRALAGVGHAATDALPVVRPLTKDADPGVAAEASYAATRIGLDPADLGLLFAKLGDLPPDARATLLGRVADLGPLVAPHDAALAKLLADDDREVKRQAIRIVSDLGPRAPRGVAAFAAALPPTDAWAQFHISGYEPLGPAFAPAVPALRKALADPSDEVAYTACRLLGGIGPEAKSATPDILALFKRTREEYRAEQVLDALGAIGPGAADAVPVVSRIVPHPLAVVTLGRIGPPAKAAAPALKKLLRDPDPDIRLAAAFALARIEGDATPYRAELARGFGGAGGIARRSLAIMTYLAPECPEFAAAAGRTLHGVGHGDTVTAIGRYGPAAADAVPDLIRLLAIEYPPELELCRTLGAIGPKAKAALPALRPLLDKQDTRIAVAAKDAIDRIEGK